MSVLGFVGKQLRHARRYNEIIGVLFKYGFDDLVAHFEEDGRFFFIKKLIPRKRYKHALALTKWQKMRKVCEELGPSFVKFGQIMSTRPDLLPPELIDELEKLQDAVPPFSGKTAKRVLEKELEKPLNEIFEELEEAPFASASLAQVHKAILKNGGKKVVLKIQRPGITKVIQEDIQIMQSIAEMLERNIPSIRVFSPVDLVKNYEKSIMQELDFVHESINIQRFRQDFIDNQNVHVPAVYKDLTTSCVITMEFIDGIKVSKIGLFAEHNLDKVIITKRIVNAFWDQVFHNGFFHADPHAGNLLLMENNKVCFIDFGMMGSILKSDILLISDMVMAIESKNTHKIMHTLQRFSEDSSIQVTKRLEYDLYEFVNNYSIQTLNNSEISTLFLTLKDIIVKHKLKVPMHFYLLTRAIVSLEGVIRQLDSELDMMKVLRPYMLELITRKFNPFQFIRKLFNATYEFGLYVEDIPQDIKETIRKIKAGKIKVDLAHKGIDPLTNTINRIGKQLAASIIASATFIGSALIIVAKMPPLWGEIPILGIVGISISTIIAIGLFFDLIKKDKGY